MLLKAHFFPWLVSKDLSSQCSLSENRALVDSICSLLHSRLPENRNRNMSSSPGVAAREPGAMPWEMVSRRTSQSSPHSQTVLTNFAYCSDESSQRTVAANEASQFEFAACAQAAAAAIRHNSH